MKINIKILDESLFHEYGYPEYATIGSAGIDLRAAIENELTIEPASSVLIPTGWSMHIGNPNVAAIILPRSGLGHKQGLVLGNLVGLIDSDYQGQIMVSLWNRSTEIRTIKRGDRIAQLVFIPVSHATFNVVEEWEETERGEGGFGSTGINLNKV